MDSDEDVRMDSDDDLQRDSDDDLPVPPNPQNPPEVIKLTAEFVRLFVAGDKKYRDLLPQASTDESKSPSRDTWFPISPHKAVVIRELPGAGVFRPTIFILDVSASMRAMYATVLVIAQKAQEAGCIVILFSDRSKAYIPSEEITMTTIEQMRGGTVYSSALELCPEFLVEGCYILMVTDGAPGDPYQIPAAIAAVHEKLGATGTFQAVFLSQYVQSINPQYPAILDTLNHSGEVETMIINNSDFLSKLRPILAMTVPIKAGQPNEVCVGNKRASLVDRKSTDPSFTEPENVSEACAIATAVMALLHHTKVPYLAAIRSVKQMLGKYGDSFGVGDLLNQLDHLGCQKAVVSKETSSILQQLGALVTSSVTAEVKFDDVLLKAQIAMANNPCAAAKRSNRAATKIASRATTDAKAIKGAGEKLCKYLDGIDIQERELPMIICHAVKVPNDTTNPYNQAVTLNPGSLQINLDGMTRESLTTIKDMAPGRTVLIIPDEAPADVLSASLKLARFYVTGNPNLPLTGGAIWAFLNALVARGPKLDAITLAIFRSLQAYLVNDYCKKKANPFQPHLPGLPFYSTMQKESKYMQLPGYAHNTIFAPVFADWPPPSEQTVKQQFRVAFMTVMSGVWGEAKANVNAKNGEDEKSQTPTLPRICIDIRAKPIDPSKVLEEVVKCGRVNRAFNLQKFFAGLNIQTDAVTVQAVLRIVEELCQQKVNSAYTCKGVAPARIPMDQLVEWAVVVASIKLPSLTQLEIREMVKQSKESAALVIATIYQLCGPQGFGLSVVHQALSDYGDPVVNPNHIEVQLPKTGCVDEIQRIAHNYLSRILARPMQHLSPEEFACAVQFFKNPAAVHEYILQLDPRRVTANDLNSFVGKVMRYCTDKEAFRRLVTFSPDCFAKVRASKLSADQRKFILMLPASEVPSWKLWSDCLEFYASTFKKKNPQHLWPEFLQTACANMQGTTQQQRVTILGVSPSAPLIPGVDWLQAYHEYREDAKIDDIAMKALGSLAPFYIDDLEKELVRALQLQGGIQPTRLQIALGATVVNHRPPVSMAGQNDLLLQTLQPYLQSTEFHIARLPPMGKDVLKQTALLIAAQSNSANNDTVALTPEMVTKFYVERDQRRRKKQERKDERRSAKGKGPMPIKRKNQDKKYDLRRELLGRCVIKNLSKKSVCSMIYRQDDYVRTTKFRHYSCAVDDVIVP